MEKDFYLKKTKTLAKMKTIFIIESEVIDS